VLQNKLFDHKAICVEFNIPAPKVFAMPTISNKELNDDFIDYVIKSTVAETYLKNCRQMQINEGDLALLLNTCGTIKQLIRDCGPPPEFCLGDNPDPARTDDRNRKITRLQILTNRLNIPALEQLLLDVNPTVFMETLLNNLKVETISHQISIRKCKKNKINSMTDKLCRLKKNYLTNLDQINELERDLNVLLDLDMRSDLERYRHFDILNCEKMSPRFLSIAKQTKKLIL
jgi:DNA-binding LytR/AlgR family response regulator